MKLLIVSWYFPPVNTIGAVRVGKFARFLIERGHDIGVVAGSEWGHPETLPLGATIERSAYVGSKKPGSMRRFAAVALRRIHSLGAAGGRAAPIVSTMLTHDAPSRALQGSLLRRLKASYAMLATLPDNRRGWLPNAYEAGCALCRDWRPDLIFASGPPFTAYLTARRLSHKLNIPWVAELRDRWADDPYAEWPQWRRSLDQWLERRTLGTASALVTVSEPWAEFYRGKYGKSVATIYNGYDPLDFAIPPETVPPPSGPNIVIGYTGSIYPGRRDPTPLFEALRLLGSLGERFRVVFVATSPAHVLPLAERAGVRHLVELRPALPYAQSLEFQRHCDLLLLMQWNDPREQGNCPGKFFEYIASLRPMLILGLEDGVPATIARERSAGHCINDPTAIASQLRIWLHQREENGFIPALLPSARDGLSRTLQYERLEEFLRALL